MTPEYRVQALLGLPHPQKTSASLEPYLLHLIICTQETKGIWEAVQLTGTGGKSDQDQKEFARISLRLGPQDSVDSTGSYQTLAWWTKTEGTASKLLFLEPHSNHSMIKGLVEQLSALNWVSWAAAERSRPEQPLVTAWIRIIPQTSASASVSRT